MYCNKKIISIFTATTLLSACGGSDSSLETPLPIEAPLSFAISGVVDRQVNENTAFISSTPSTSGDTPIGALTWSLTGVDVQWFSINSSTGVFSLAAQNYELAKDEDTNNVYQVTIETTDSENNKASKAISVTVLDVDDGEVMPTPDPTPEPTPDPVPAPEVCVVSPEAINSNALYVSPTGLDADIVSGSEASPYQSLSYALSTIATAGVINEAGLTIYLREGEYHDSIDSLSLNGSENNHLSIEAFPCETVTLSGAASIESFKLGDWQKFHGEIYKIEIDRPVWKLYVDNKMQMVSRWPNANFDMPSITNTASVYSAAVWAEGEQDSGSKGTSSDDWGNKKDGIMTNDISGSDHLVTYHNLSSATDYKGDLLDVTGAIIVANTASFYTFTRQVKSYNDMDDNFKAYNAFTGALHNYPNKDIAHLPGSNVFTYEPSFKAYKAKKLSYFLEGKVELIDQAGEWHYQVESGKHYVYLWHPQGGKPASDVNVRDIGYAFDIANSNHVTIKGINFFASTLRCNPCNNITIADNIFTYSASDRRVLKEFGTTDTGYGRNQYIELYSALDKRINSGIVFRNNKVTDSGVQSLIVSGGQSVVTNNLFKRLDWTSADTVTPHATVMIRDMAAQKVEFSYNTMDIIGNSTMFVPEGGSLHATFNDMGTGGFAQNDGASFQLRKAQQAAVNMAYNWAHDSEKYGIRFDAPFNTTNETSGGQWGMIHHNVVWNAKGIMVKGDDHRVYHNTMWNNKDVDLRMLIDSNIFYRHERSIAANNASDSMSSKRDRMTDVTGLYLGENMNDARMNFNGAILDDFPLEQVFADEEAESERLEPQLMDIHNRDFRPKRGGELHDTGAIINSPNSYDNYLGSAPMPQYIESVSQGLALDLGAYELDSAYYWIPGFKEAQASFPIPRDEITDNEALSVTPTVSLMWREAYQATEHYLYLSSSKTDIEQVEIADLDHSTYKGTYRASEANIFQDSDGLSVGTYYWRVDALVKGLVVKGSLWQFTVN